MEAEIRLWEWCVQWQVRGEVEEGHKNPKLQL